MRTVGNVDELPNEIDVAIIGAGPAGLAAAAAVRPGRTVVLFDENPEPGGQIYRGITSSTPLLQEMLGPDYRRGKELVADFAAADVAYAPRATVWMVSADRELAVSIAGRSRLVTARHVILATGALERPFPIPGWTLPGVMTCGGLQGTLKNAGLVPDGNFVIAGTGPLLWLLAYQLMAAGAKPKAILDTTQTMFRAEVLKSAAPFLASPYLRKGRMLMREVRKAVPVISGVTELVAHGTSGLEAISYRKGRGEMQRIEADSLFLHQGVIPNVNMANALGCEMIWDETQLCWKPKTDAWGRTSIADISIVGDGAGIGGAEVAAASGAMAGLDVSGRLGLISDGERDRLAAAHRDQINLYGKGRRFLDMAFQPHPSFLLPADETLACRCEEVTAGQIRATLRDLGDVGPNQVKSYLRCGMGPCQGRMCGPTVAAIIAAERGLSPEQVGYFRLRFPIKPTTVAEIATMPFEEKDLRAVVRG